MLVVATGRHSIDVRFRKPQSIEIDRMIQNTPMPHDSTVASTFDLTDRPPIPMSANRGSQISIAVLGYTLSSASGRSRVVHTSDRSTTDHRLDSPKKFGLAERFLRFVFVASCGGWCLPRLLIHRTSPPPSNHSRRSSRGLSACLPACRLNSYWHRELPPLFSPRELRAFFSSAAPSSTKHQACWARAAPSLPSARGSSCRGPHPGAAVEAGRLPRARGLMSTSC